MRRAFFHYIYCVFFLILFFSLGMIFVYQIPNTALEPQYSKSVDQLEKEETYPNLLFSADGAILDNFMDKIMIRTCSISEAYDNMIHAAFDNNGYPRYWNGYLLTLRPFLSQFSYQQIRYINMFLLITAFCFCFSGIQRKINSAAAAGFAVSIIACFFVFISESLQYFSVFFILFLTILVLLYSPFFQTAHKTTLLLLSVGMITNFFDLLTAPLITLGIPLIIIICLNYHNNEKSTFLNQLVLIVTHSISWCLGYSLCWISKWAIGSLILKTNVFEDALKTAQFRVYGSEQYPLDRKLMLNLNFNSYFFAKGHKPAIFIAVIIFILLLLMVFRHKKNWYNILFPVLFVGLTPYVWYFAFANHSQLHYFYTFRIQAITLFSVFASISCAIDWDRLAQRKENTNFIYSDKK